MATRLATQRNFVTITPANLNNKSNEDNSDTSTELIAITSTDQNIATNPTNGIPITHVLSQKKLMLQTVSGLDVIPIDASDSSSESQVAIITTQNDSISSPSDSTSSNSQHLTAQVAVVQPQSPTDDSCPHFITVTVSSQESSGGHGTYQVQYVDPELYTTNSQNQGQMNNYPFCAVGEYTTNGQPYYTTTGNYGTSPNTSVTHSSGLPYIVPVDDSILVTSQNRESPHSLTTEVAYIQGNPNTQQQQTPTSTTTTTSLTETENSPSLSHATRISPATVAWLVENYETADGVSLPRSTLYNHYMRHCNENKLDAVNAASFGKLIRSVFTGLRTRRLGTRGNSKYHYYGIRIKPDSTLIHAIEERTQNLPGQSNTGNTQIPMSKKKSKAETYEGCAQYLGDGSNAIPVIPHIDLDDEALPDEITIDDIDAFRSIYREHCELFLDAVLNLEFSTVESLWRDFWRASDNNNINECEEEKYLSKTKLYLMCQYESIQNFIKQVDYHFYQKMVEVLIPDVLRSIPNALTQAIRTFAKNLETWLTESMEGCPEKMIQIKTAAVSAFCQTLRRYTSLNHLAQAARAVLQNSSQIAQMLNDLNRVDFRNVQEQAAWVCQCDSATVQRLENDFKSSLQQQNSLEQWAGWLRLIVDTALDEYNGKPNFTKAARQFLLKWSFYSSMVIRDLTLRSASSFGSFHLIRLLYDEYMFFIVEHKVAEAQQTTPIAVMSETDRMHSDTDIEFICPMDFDIKTEPSCKRIKLN